MEELDIAGLRGLTEEEAAAKLASEGCNEIPAGKGRGPLAVALEVIREPMFLLLIAGCAIYFVLGDIQEGLLLLGFVVVIVGITFYQENKTENALRALRDMASPRAKVIREGAQKRIAGRDVVRGDTVMLAEGDRVPADGILIMASNLYIDESILTGESVPVRKTSAAVTAAMERPGGDRQVFLYSGTLVVSGQGIFTVLETGSCTEFGRIGRALESLQPEDTPLQRETGRLVRSVAILGTGLSVVVAVVYAVTRGDWVRGVLSGITLAMAVLPEEFPVVLTVFLALGAWRISKKHVLTRRTPVVELLGSATVLCVDKTGTLTLNRMSIQALEAGGVYYDAMHSGHEGLPDELHELIEFGILASQKDPFDPMERAFKELGERRLAHTEHLHGDWRLVREYPLSDELLAMSHVWVSPDERDILIAAKGAPEAIADLCHFSLEEMDRMLEEVARMAASGLRVLGVAKGSRRREEFPSIQHDFWFEFVGLVGLRDPIRASVPPAIRECYEAGVRVIMLTGDYPGTARYIAQLAGIRSHDEVITGPELDAMDDAVLRERIGDVNVFARIVPEQKLRLVQALKANHEVVAMTGDGVNDAPALKAAHIGIAMGSRGTDVAREAASLVLLDDDFSSIVAAVRAGRRIYDNLRKAVAYIIAVHVPIAGMSLLPVLLGWPLVLMPAHVLFLELIIDPSCSVAFEAEPEEHGIMRRPPIRRDRPMFNRRMLALSALQGGVSLAVIALVYAFSLHSGLGANGARALAFSTLIAANLSLILSNRSWSRLVFETVRVKNRTVWLVVAGALAFLLLVLYVPSLRLLFRFSSVPVLSLVVAILSGMASVIWFEIWKAVRRSR